MVEYRIVQQSEIRIYGRMPNSNKTGWYLFGYTDSIADRAALATNLINTDLDDATITRMVRGSRRALRECLKAYSPPRAQA